MANNLHISYTLYRPGQDYEAVINAIKGLGNWARIHPSFWYVNSTLTAAQAATAVWRVMDANDSLYVVDATNNIAAWHNFGADVERHIKDQWYK